MKKTRSARIEKVGIIGGIILLILSAFAEEHLKDHWASGQEILLVIGGICIGNAAREADARMERAQSKIQKFLWGNDRDD